MHRPPWVDPAIEQPSRPSIIPGTASLADWRTDRGVEVWRLEVGLSRALDPVWLWMKGWCEPRPVGGVRKGRRQAAYTYLDQVGTERRAGAGKALSALPVLCSMSS